MNEGFSLHKRGNIWYVQFRNQDGSYNTAKSTHKTHKGDATVWAIEYLKSGQVVVKEKVTIDRFAKDFFYFDSAYVKYKESIGHYIGKTYLKIQQGYLENYILIFFKGYKLKDINTSSIKRFQQHLSEEKGLSNKSINHITSTLRILLKEALEEKLIPTLPVIKNRMQSQTSTRGILSIDEVKELFNTRWDNKQGERI